MECELLTPNTAKLNEHFTNIACRSKGRTTITSNELLESEHRKPNYTVQSQLLSRKDFMSDSMRSISLKEMKKVGDLLSSFSSATPKKFVWLDFLSAHSGFKSMQHSIPTSSIFLFQHSSVNQTLTNIPCCLLLYHF